MAVNLDRNKLLSRVQKITSSWTWQLDALVVITGKTADDAVETKSLALNHYLLGIEFPETAIAILRTGTVVFFTSAKKMAHLKQVEGPGVDLIEKGGGDDTQTQEFLARLKGERDKSRIGMLLKETHIGPWAPTCVSTITSSDAFEVVECRDEISQIMAIKDEHEQKMCEKAALFAQLFLQDAVITKIEEVIDRDVKQTNNQIANILERMMDGADLVKEWEAKHSMDPQDLELVYVSVQSGKEFDLKPASTSNDEILPMEGCYLLSVGMKYMEYSACITRTLLVNPKPPQRDAYVETLAVFNLILDCLKPGVSFKDIYDEARKHVRQKKPELVDKFVKNVGFSTGLEFKDQQLVVSERSERKVAPGMVLVVSVGFVEMDSDKPWAVWIADTVVVLPDGSDTRCRQLTNAGKQYNEVVYELDEKPEELAEEPAATQQPRATRAAVHALPPQATASAKEKPKGRPKAGEKKTPAEPKTSRKSKGDQAHSKPDKKEKKDKTAKADRVRDSNTQTTTVAAEQLQKKRASRMQETNKEIAAQIEMEQANIKLREKKFQELHERFANQVQERQRNAREASQLTDIKAYSYYSQMPANLRPNRVHIDMTAEALLTPICGSIVPFHLRTIKNMAKQQADNMHILRVNFFTPGQGKSLEDYPIVNGQRVYVKELSFRSAVSENFDAVMRQFKEMQKRSKQCAIEGEVRRAEERSGLQEAKLETLKSFPCIRDVHMRPSMGGRGRTTGTLEAHTNGFRFSMKGSAGKLDVLYSRIEHIIFQPCEERALLVIIHFNLKEPIMVGKRKSQDIQFFAECGNLTEDLSLRGQQSRRAANVHDPDEILEEEREREWKQRLNEIFREFMKKVENLPTFKTSNLKIDMPYTELQFHGVPLKTSVMLVPCDGALVSLEEFPPFCLALSNIDVAVFERVTPQLREFDMCFIPKDYKQPIIRITTVPSVRRDVLKKWLSKIKIPLYEVPMNMQWSTVMTHINADIQQFLADGGWDAWFGQDSESDQSASEGASGDGDDYQPDESEQTDASDSGDAWEPSSEEESAPGESEPSDGESLDELERKAELADRKRDAELRAGKAPPGKRQRR